MSGVVSIPSDILRIAAYVKRIGDLNAKGHPWLHDFKDAVIHDADLEHALEVEDPVMARNALAALAFRLFKDSVPDSVRVSLASLGVALP